MAEQSTQIALFKGKEIRKTIHDDEWWFSVVDVVEALTDSDRPRKYWSDLKKKLIKEGYNEVSEKIGQLKLASLYEYPTPNTEFPMSKGRYHHLSNPKFTIQNPQFTR